MSDMSLTSIYRPTAMPTWIGAPGIALLGLAFAVAAAMSIAALRAWIVARREIRQQPKKGNDHE